MALTEDRRVGFDLDVIQDQYRPDQHSRIMNHLWRSQISGKTHLDKGGSRDANI
jgi:hypothetical protein